MNEMNKIFIKIVIVPIIAIVGLITVRNLVVPNITSVQETEQGIQLNFEDGSGYWIEK